MNFIPLRLPYPFLLRGEKELLNLSLLGKSACHSTAEVLVPRCIFSMQARTIYVWQLPNQKIYKDGKLMWKSLFRAVAWLGGTFAAAGISPMDLLLFHSILLMSLWWVTICFSRYSLSPPSLSYLTPPPHQEQCISQGSWVWLGGSLWLIEWGKQWPLLIPSGCWKTHWENSHQPSDNYHRGKWAYKIVSPSAWVPDGGHGAEWKLPDCPWLQGRNKCCKPLTFSLCSIITVKADWYNHHFIHSENIFGALPCIRFHGYSLRNKTISSILRHLSI